jgi:hypothetical protein
MPVKRKLQLVINQNYVEMHGQQNIKFLNVCYMNFMFQGLEMQLTALGTVNDFLIIGFRCTTYKYTKLVFPNPRIGDTRGKNEGRGFHEYSKDAMCLFRGPGQCT